MPHLQFEVTDPLDGDDVESFADWVANRYAGVIEEMADRWGVSTENQYVIYTEHPGEDFHLREGALDSWSAEEADDPPGEG